MTTELIEQAYALYARINKERSAYFPGQPNRVRLGKLRYRAWKRWERRVAAYGTNACAGWGCVDGCGDCQPATLGVTG